jgi:hypothetical protein
MLAERGSKKFAKSMPKGSLRTAERRAPQVYSDWPNFAAFGRYLPLGCRPE